MTRIVTTAAAVSLATLAGACASTGQGADPAALAGCYYFDQDQVARQLQLPWGVRLLDRPLTGWPALQQLDDVRVASTLTGRDEADHPFGYWRLVEGDSLVIGYPAGGGLSLRLGLVDGGLNGTATPVGDATLDSTRPLHGIRLIHARCPEDV